MHKQLKQASLTTAIALVLDFLLHYLPFIGATGNPLIYYGVKLIVWFAVAYGVFLLSGSYLIKSGTIAITGAILSAIVLVYLQPTNYELLTHMAHAVVLFVGAYVSLNIFKR